MATVRYLVDDVGAAVAFYSGLLGFEVKQQFGPNMAIVAKDDPLPGDVAWDQIIQWVDVSLVR